MPLCRYEEEKLSTRKIILGWLVFLCCLVLCYSYSLWVPVCWSSAIGDRKVRRERKRKRNTNTILMDRRLSIRSCDCVTVFFFFEWKVIIKLEIELSFIPLLLQCAGLCIVVRTGHFLLSLGKNTVIFSETRRKPSVLISRARELCTDWL